MADNDFSKTELSHEYDNLIAGGESQVRRVVDVQSGNHLRGTVMQDAGSNEYAPYDGLSGSVPTAILAETVDIESGATAKATIYEKGEFNENEIILPSGVTADDVRALLREVSIFIKPAVQMDAPGNP